MKYTMQGILHKMLSVPTILSKTKYHLIPNSSKLSYRRFGRTSKNDKLVEITLIYTVKERKILQTILLEKHC